SRSALSVTSSRRPARPAPCSSAIAPLHTAQDLPPRFHYAPVLSAHLIAAGAALLLFRLPPFPRHSPPAASARAHLPSPSPPPPSLRDGSSTPLLSLPTRSDTLSPSPAHLFSPRTRSFRLPGIFPDLPSGTSVLPLPYSTHPARTSPPSALPLPHTLSPLPPLRHRFP